MGGGTTRKVLLAPITVTPSKPLTPSHLKGLLWTDVMFRATAPLADVTYRYSHTTYHPTEQTLGFWEFLDRTLGDTDYASLSEDEMGEGPGERNFARLDTDNDGAISKAEAEEAMQHRRKRGHGWGMGDH